MKKETYIKILRNALLRLEEKQSLCTLDTIMRIDEVGTCRECVIRNVVNVLICPNEVKQEVKGLLK